MYLFFLVTAMIVVQIFPLAPDGSSVSSLSLNHLRKHSSVEAEGVFMSPVPATEPNAEDGTPVAVEPQQDLASSPDRSAEIVRPTRSVERPSWQLADGQQVLNLQFDLSSTPTGDGGLQVVKPMRVDGNVVGDVAITINSSSRLFVSASDLRRVLPGPLARRVEADAGLIAFDRLREMGIVIRYDPVSDALQVTS